MATFFIIPDPTELYLGNDGPWAQGFFRVDLFGCGELDEAAQQGIVLTDEDLIVPPSP